MTSPQLFFAYFALSMTALSVLVVTRRNPVHSVLWMLVLFIHIAALYLFLNAEFLAAVQIIVYAGAILVLFLFVIMLLNVEKEATAPSGHGFQKFWALVLCVIVAVSLISIMTVNVFTGEKGIYSPELVNEAGNSEIIGRLLFTDFLLPFEITSILLLAAIIGAVILSKKKL